MAGAVSLPVVFEVVRAQSSYASPPTTAWAIAPSNLDWHWLIIWQMSLNGPSRVAFAQNVLSEGEPAVSIFLAM
jgi:hypothetical protein